MLQWSPNAADAYSNHLFPHLDSFDRCPNIILEDLSDDESWEPGALVQEKISVTVKQLDGIRSWNDKAGNVSIFDSSQRPLDVSTAESIQVMVEDECDIESECLCPKTSPQSPVFNNGHEDSRSLMEPEILFQPETRPISPGKLFVGVKAIYAGLVKVEAKCIEVDQQESFTTHNLSNEQWQSLIALHKFLLLQHSDFFLASQHPSSRLSFGGSCRDNDCKAYNDPAVRSSGSAGGSNILPCGNSDNFTDLNSESTSHKSQNGKRGLKLLLERRAESLLEKRANLNAKGGTYGHALSSTSNSTMPQSGSRMQCLKRLLPMFLKGSRYNTTPDTGSLENAISAEEARRLGLKITGRGRQFLMGNGSKTISLGTVRLKCAFALGERCVARLSFNVIDNLVVPVIIGKTFLDISKILTLHQHRLEAVWMSTKKAFRVMHLNRPRQLVRCYVNGKLVHANPDTGSEVDLMSPSYAHENTLKIEALEEGEDWIQLADGRTAKLLGKTHVDLDFYDGRYGSSTGYIGHSRTFYLLDGLRTDVLLGHQILFDMHVFTEHEDSFVDSDCCGLSIEMSLITWFDKRTRQVSDTLAVLSSTKSKQSKSVAELLFPFSSRNTRLTGRTSSLTSSLQRQLPKHKLL